MGVRKRESAERRKEIMKTTAIASLKNVPTSPRKMRMVADLIRGQEVMKALNILHYNEKAPAARLEKLLHSAIANWESKSGEIIAARAHVLMTVFFLLSIIFVTFLSR